MAIHFFIITLLVVFLLLWGKLFIDNFRKEQSPILKILVCIICACIFKFDWGINFLGLEYEDAYSFSAYTRQLSYGVISDSLRIQCVDIGSISEPLSLGTYGGHYITYSTFLYLFTSIFGFSISNISIINSIISLLSLLSLAFYQYKDKYNWLIAVMIYCLAPAINLFSTCFLSETFSAFLGICFVLSILNFRNDNSTFSKLFTYISFALCILTKRDNTALIIIPAVLFTFAVFNKNYKLAFSYIIPYFIILVASSIFVHNFFIAEMEESADIAQSTFSLQIFCSQFPIYLKSLFSFKYFNVSIYLFILCCVLSFRKIISNENILCLIILFLSELIMYSSHYRGYYFIENLEPLNEFATFRYLNNFYFIIPICLAMLCQIPSKLKSTAVFSLIFLSVISAFITFNIRRNAHIEEYDLRFKDINVINNTIAKDDIIITDTPLLYLNVISPDRIICNIQRISEINLEHPCKFYIVADDLSTLDNRYHLNLSNINKRLVMTLPSNKKLYLIH